MLSALLAAILGALAGLLRDVLADRRANADAKDVGGLAAQVRLDNHVKEKADAQARNDAVDRGDAADVLARLRKANGDGSGAP